MPDGGLREARKLILADSDSLRDCYYVLQHLERRMMALDLTAWNLAMQRLTETHVKPEWALNSLMISGECSPPSECLDALTVGLADCPSLHEVQIHITADWSLELFRAASRNPVLR